MKKKLLARVMAGVMSLAMACEAVPVLAAYDETTAKVEATDVSVTVATVETPAPADTDDSPYEGLDKAFQRIYAAYHGANITDADTTANADDDTFEACVARTNAVLKANGVAVSDDVVRAAVAGFMSDGLWDSESKMVASLMHDFSDNADAGADEDMPASPQYTSLPKKPDYFENKFGVFYDVGRILVPDEEGCAYAQNVDDPLLWVAFHTVDGKKFSAYHAFSHAGEPTEYVRPDGTSHFWVGTTSQERIEIVVTLHGSWSDVDFTVARHYEDFFTVYQTAEVTKAGTTFVATTETDEITGENTVNIVKATCFDGASYLFNFAPRSEVDAVAPNLSGRAADLLAYANTMVGNGFSCISSIQLTSANSAVA